MKFINYILQLVKCKYFRCFKRYMKCILQALLASIERMVNGSGFILLFTLELWVKNVSMVICVKFFSQVLLALEIAL